MNFLDSYLDPFCLSAILLPLVSLERLMITGREFNTVDMIVFTIILSIISELVFPYLSAAFTRDLMDIFALCIGTGWYMFFAPQEK